MKLFKDPSSELGFDFTQILGQTLVVSITNQVPLHLVINFLRLAGWELCIKHEFDGRRDYY